MVKVARIKKVQKKPRNSKIRTRITRNPRVEIQIKKILTITTLKLILTILTMIKNIKNKAD